MISSLVGLFWILVGRLQCICRPLRVALQGMVAFRQLAKSTLAKKCYVWV